MEGKRDREGEKERKQRNVDSLFFLIRRGSPHHLVLHGTASSATPSSAFTHPHLLLEAWVSTATWVSTPGPFLYVQPAYLAKVMDASGQTQML